METAYRLVEWHWTERHGDQEFERSDFEKFPIKDTHVSSCPLQVWNWRYNPTSKVEVFVTTPVIEYSAANADLIRHTINVFLEIFRECNVLTENLRQLVQAFRCRG